ncbi:MAG: zinc-dependent dehydrogenase [Thermodesulfovibrio sp.]|uniref:zinc-dependent dehydrogenase n=1 Tax=unclassified Thermodesulfovibrio TaxID=2645936 RepID=UPI00083A7CEC|nr:MULTISPECIES: zinc-dependent dehydrogenase [unclassified Thermodesulfovibrio]MDI1472493.1 zinc-dependent dehydrogenase [Thermodesulfovibrio sp. 1176]MDI6714470.1 zinc-dependent dehydrogenase [Thermodesulfovibrio sp.]ODA43880.1 2,3-butanediol dehydrogenase, R-alcohol forming, (R)- and (S)-acetoin-specific [Thermodesulfovibrio sp. N1]
MKVAKLYKFNNIRIEEIPVPQIGKRDALVKVKVCGICSGDVMPWYIEKKAPLVLGHEISGEIIKIGDEIKEKINLKEGDRVSVHHHAPCMECFYCQRGDHVQCQTWKESKIFPGGIAEYILLPEVILKNDTLKLPDNVSFEEGAMVEPVACVVKSLKRANIKKGDTILVIGLGVMGQIHVMLAKEFGAGKVIGADMVDFRLKKALESGADFVIDVSKENILEKLKEYTKGVMAHSVIVGPGDVKIIEKSLSLLSKGGTLLIFTPTPPEQILSLSVNEIYFNDITITTSYSCGPDDTKKALEFISNGKINFNILITHRFKIEETAKAYEITAKAQNSLKCIINF